jgi:two-component system NtrC family sensor kinase
MIFSSLKAKVGVYLVIALTVAVLLFTYMVIRNNRTTLLDQAISHAAQLSGVVMKTTRFAMQHDGPGDVNRILSEVGAHEKINRVRIFSKDGDILYSTNPAEVGNTIDQEAESCLGCHLDEKSMIAAPLIGRPRVFEDADGREMLGSTAVFRNGPTCSESSCHVHSADETVLGVLDIVTPLETIQATIQKNTITIIGLSLGLLVLAAVLVSLLVQRVVYGPLDDLRKGAERVTDGDLDHSIPVRSGDELGQLAECFNLMTGALHRSRDELEGWGHTLEQKVEEATHELHRAQAEAARSEKLASVGLLAAGIAHELNNPLTGVLTFSTLVRRELPDDSPEAEDLDLVIRETKRCAKIIRRLLDFAREKTPEKSYVDINQTIDECVELISQASQLADIELVTCLEDDLPPVWMDKELIKQVIMNMLVNAQHAIEQVGAITVATRIRTDCPLTKTDISDAPMVEISIRDTGCGIEPDHLDRIFDPFFSTKGVGKGTGLGLSVSHGTIEAHGGIIEVESEVGQGSEFRICLPTKSRKDMKLVKGE